METKDFYTEGLKKLREGIYETALCQDCGKESTLYFGFGSPCRYNGGSHHNIITIPSTKEHEVNKLKAHYSCRMWFDRANFEKYAPPEIKELLRNK